jgi:AraC family ethanolamine operon transcriptional activator
MEPLGSQSCRVRAGIMLTFDDFDAWGDAVGGARLQMVCDAIETPVWTLCILDLGGVILQLASEGGGNLCYGVATHAGPTLFVPLTHPREHVANGVPLDGDSLLDIPRGADFSIRVNRRAHEWCSIALPEGRRHAARAAGARVVRRPGVVPGLKRLAREIAANLHDRPAGSAAHRAAGRELTAAAEACLEDAAAPVPRSAVGRPRLDRVAIIRRAMEAIEASASLPTAADLAQRIGVNDRTLLRSFQETFGVPSKKYLMLRELHAVRRVLASGAAGHATVGHVLVAHGILEFGRFAGRYRDHFGELPSQTLQRARS